MKLVYVAGPISKGDLLANCCRAHDAGIALLKAGFAVIVPHGSCFWGNLLMGRLPSAFVPEVLPKGTVHEQWLAGSLELVRRCDCVVRLPGESKGADMEVALARELGKPVYHSVEEFIYAETGAGQ